MSSVIRLSISSPDSGKLFTVSSRIRFRKSALLSVMYKILLTS